MGGCATSLRRRYVFVPFVLALLYKGFAIASSVGVRLQPLRNASKSNKYYGLETYFEHLQFHIPPVMAEGNGYILNLTSIHCNESHINDALFRQHPPSDISMELSGLSSGCGGNWNAQFRIPYLGWIQQDGSFTVNIVDSSVYARTHFSMSEGEDFTKLKSVLLEVCLATLTFDNLIFSGDMSFSIGTNTVLTLLGNRVESTVCNGLRQLVDGTSNTSVVSLLKQMDQSPFFSDNLYDSSPSLDSECEPQDILSASLKLLGLVPRAPGNNTISSSLQLPQTVFYHHANVINVNVSSSNLINVLVHETMMIDFNAFLNGIRVAEVILISNLGILKAGFVELALTGHVQPALVSFSGSPNNLSFAAHLADPRFTAEGKLAFLIANATTNGDLVRAEFEFEVQVLDLNLWLAFNLETKSNFSMLFIDFLAKTAVSMGFDVKGQIQKDLCDSFSAPILKSAPLSTNFSSIGISRLTPVSNDSIESLTGNLTATLIGFVSSELHSLQVSGANWYLNTALRQLIDDIILDLTQKSTSECMASLDDQKEVPVNTAWLGQVIMLLMFLVLELGIAATAWAQHMQYSSRRSSVASEGQLHPADANQTNNVQVREHALAIAERGSLFQKSETTLWVKTVIVFSIGLLLLLMTVHFSTANMEIQSHFGQSHTWYSFHFISFSAWDLRTMPWLAEWSLRYMSLWFFSVVFFIILPSAKIVLLLLFWFRKGLHQFSAEMRLMNIAEKTGVLWFADWFIVLLVSWSLSIGTDYGEESDKASFQAGISIVPGAGFAAYVFETVLALILVYASNCCHRHHMSLRSSSIATESPSGNSVSALHAKKQLSFSAKTFISKNGKHFKCTPLGKVFVMGTMALTVLCFIMVGTFPLMRVELSQPFKNNLVRMMGSAGLPMHRKILVGPILMHGCSLLVVLFFPLLSLFCLLTLWIIPLNNEQFLLAYFMAKTGRSFSAAVVFWVGILIAKNMVSVATNQMFDEFGDDLTSCIQLCVSLAPAFLLLGAAVVLYAIVFSMLTVLMLRSAGGLTSLANVGGIVELLVCHIFIGRGMKFSTVLFEEISPTTSSSKEASWVQNRQHKDPGSLGAENEANSSNSVQQKSTDLSPIS